MKNKKELQVNASSEIIILLYLIGFWLMRLSVHLIHNQIYSYRFDAQYMGIQFSQIIIGLNLILSNCFTSGGNEQWNKVFRISTIVNYICMIVEIIHFLFLATIGTDLVSYIIWSIFPYIYVEIMRSFYISFKDVIKSYEKDSDILGTQLIQILIDIVISITFFVGPLLIWHKKQIVIVTSFLSIIAGFRMLIKYNHLLTKRNIWN